MRADEHLIPERTVLTPGTRVRLAYPSFEVTLRSDRGTIVGPDPDCGDIGYYVVRLDQPALFDDRVSPPEEVTEIVELLDNMEVAPE